MQKDCLGNISRLYLRLYKKIFPCTTITIFFFTHCVKPKAAQVQINSIVNSNIQRQ